MNIGFYWGHSGGEAEGERIIFRTEFVSFTKGYLILSYCIVGKNYFVDSFTIGC